MLAFLCTRRLQITVSPYGSIIQLGFIQNGLLFSFKSLSTALNVKLESLKPKQDEHKQYSSYTVSYLVNSCGFSPELAESVAKKINNKTPDRADQVVSLLRDYGFTDAHISRVIRKRPRLLLANPRKILLPKLEFFCSVGVSRLNLVKMVCLDPDLLIRSLEHNLIPSYNILKSVLISDDKVVMALKRSSIITAYGVQKNLSVNLSVLREVGVPESIISSLVTYKPGLVCMKSAKFRYAVNKVVELGFNPLKSTFVQALDLVPLMKNALWDQKMEVYKSWGLSEDEIWSAIRKYPMCMCFSTSNIIDKMDFFVNKMGWPPADVARIPSVVSYSLEKRIVPRCSVVKVLLLKGLVEGEISIASVITSSEENFLDLFVIKHLEKVPQLLNIFQGEMNIVELGYGFDEKNQLSSLV